MSKSNKKISISSNQIDDAIELLKIGYEMIGVPNIEILRESQSIRDAFFNLLSMTVNIKASQVDKDLLGESFVIISEAITPFFKQDI